MEILSPTQIHLCDLQYFDYKGVESIDLMENAALALKNELVASFPKDTVFQILCGSGNNGGDGLALARLLKAEGYSVEVELFLFSDKASKDFTINLERLRNTNTSINEYKNSNDFFLYPGAIIVDALFGVGLTRKLEGEWLEVICKVNAGDNVVVAVDVPSGLLCESKPSSEVIEANITLTFERPKLCFFFKESAPYVGEIKIVGIGLNQKFIGSFKDNETIELLTAKSIHKKREKFGHKGTYGHAAIIAGSEGKMGAAVLSAKSCIHSGAGLVTAIVPGKGLNIIQTAVPEVMAFPGGEGYEIENITSLEQFDAVGVGPGLGTFKKAEKLLSQILKLVNCPIFLDADALNILSANKKLLKLLPKDAVLTPHPGEFKRLVGDFSDSYEAFQKLKDFCKTYSVVTVLKGANSIVCTPEGKCFFNITGNPGMATAGSGDVLTGLITSLLAQGYTSVNAACLGVFLHGLSGDIAVKETSEEGLTAGKLIENVGKAFATLY
ncbi:MAG: NAD(P)H-hydrate dehydratase [Flavobacteriales bacterium]